MKKVGIVMGSDSDLPVISKAVDVLRERFGEDIVQRARFLNGKIDHMAGGLSKERRTGVTKEV